MYGNNGRAISSRGSFRGIKLRAESSLVTSMGGAVIMMISGATMATG